LEVVGKVGEGGAMRYRAAFLIAPERMQRVQTFIRFTDEPTSTRTRCRFGIQRRLDTLWAWLIRLPKTGALPQTSHILAMFDSLRKNESGGL
jgi:hypothetical protein